MSYTGLTLDSYNQPNILFLRGCFLNDCNSIEDMFDEQLVNRSMLDSGIYQEKEIEYDTIPPLYTSDNTWIKQTNIKCWSCDCNFQNIPIFIPTSIERSNNVEVMYGSMDTLGNFCSWNCAALYINTYYTRDEKWEKHEMLKVLYKVFTGSDIDYIVPSPPKTQMIQYGGKKSKQEYRSILMTLNDVYSTSIKHNSITYISK